MPKHLELHESLGTAGDVVLVRLLDKRLIDTAILQELAAELNALLDEGHAKLVLSFARVEIASSPLINVMIKVVGKLREKSGGLRICDLSAPVREVLGFWPRSFRQVIAVKTTEEEALADF